MTNRVIQTTRTAMRYITFLFHKYALYILFYKTIEVEFFISMPKLGDKETEEILSKNDNLFKVIQC